MAASEIEIRSMEPHDWVEVRCIYLEGIATGNATFETEAPSLEKWTAPTCRIPDSSPLMGRRLWDGQR
jgi:L-amino acid N-acyltransferase YncA